MSDTSTPGIVFNFGEPCELSAQDAGCAGFVGAACLPGADGGGVCTILCHDSDWETECRIQLGGDCAPDGGICFRVR